MGVDDSMIKITDRELKEREGDLASLKECLHKLEVKRFRLNQLVMDEYSLSDLEGVLHSIFSSFKKMERELEHYNRVNRGFTRRWEYDYDILEIDNPVEVIMKLLGCAEEEAGMILSRARECWCLPFVYKEHQYIYAYRVGKLFIYDDDWALSSVVEFDDLPNQLSSEPPVQEKLGTAINLLSSWLKEWKDLHPENIHRIEACERYFGKFVYELQQLIKE